MSPARGLGPRLPKGCPCKLGPKRLLTRKGKYTENQTVSTLNQVEAGRQVKDVCRELGISNTICYVWISRYGGV